MYRKAIEYEDARQLELIKSKKIAWIIASIAVMLNVLSISAIFLMLPLKTVVPYVIKENVVTGETRIVTMLDKKTLATDEATDKFFASDYVKKREQYYYNILEKDYYHVLLYSDKQVQNEYQSIYSGEKGRDKLLSNNFKVEVEILAVVLDQSAGTKIAQVRSKVTTIDLDSATEGITSFLTSTLAYEYQPNKEMKEEDRLLNPLGFTVLTYRKDREVQQ